MAQATNDFPLIQQGESSTAAAIPRDNDPLSLALRRQYLLDIDDIAVLNQAGPPLPCYDTLSSIGSSDTAIFSDQKNSTITKPTTVHANQVTTPPGNGKGKGKGKGKAPAVYASSLSGTHGSVSDAEAERKATRRHELFAIGAWADTTLKGAARAKERTHGERQPVTKKVEVILTQERPASRLLHESSNGDVVISTYAQNPKDKKYLRPRSTKQVDDSLRLAEEGQIQVASPLTEAPAPLSRTRLFSLVGLGSLMVCTVIAAATAARFTGKDRLACTKAIVFVATAMLTTFIILAMLIARRAVSEALLAGLIMLVFGIALVAELDDFMRPF